jgi:hypothetical protein
MRKYPLQNIEEIIVKKSEKKVKKYPRFLVQTGFVENILCDFLYKLFCRRDCGCSIVPTSQTFVKGGYAKVLDFSKIDIFIFVQN